jgi:hypothetical protein
MIKAGAATYVAADLRFNNPKDFARRIYLEMAEKAAKLALNEC